MLYVGLFLLLVALVLFLMFAVSNEDVYKYLSAFFAALGFLILLCLGMFRLGQQSILIGQQLEQQRIEQNKLVEELGITEEQLQLLRK